MPYNQNERILMVAKENALQAVLTAAQTIFSTFFLFLLEFYKIGT